MDAKTEPFDPAAHGWEPYADEGFIGLVGPFWMKKDGESYRYRLPGAEEAPQPPRRACRAA